MQKITLRATLGSSYSVDRPGFPSHFLDPKDWYRLRDSLKRRCGYVETSYMIDDLTYVWQFTLPSKPKQS